MGSPSAIAAATGLIRTTPAPSPRAYPFALASNVLQRPSAERKPPFDSAMVMVGTIITLAPPATASEHSPPHSDWQARWTATSDAEQAVSTARLGPRNPNTYESRLASIVIIIPVAEW